MVLKLINFPLLFFVGGYVSHTPLPALQSAIVAVSGPATNFLIWGICVLIVKFKLINRKYYKIVIPMGRISMFLGIFNMIPIPGFDGNHFFVNLFRVFGG
jgi:Zn-dependent protease